MKNKKGLLVSLIAVGAVLLAGTAGGVYAYWAGTINAPTPVDQGDQVTIGVGQEINTSLSVGAQVGTGVLVPAGRAGVGQVEYVVLTNSVTWLETTTTLATGHAGTLSAVVKDGTVKIDGSVTNAGLVGITIQVGGTAPVDGAITATASNAIALAGSPVVTYIKVTLGEPESQTIYQAVAGKTITFDVTFSVSPSSN